MIRYLPQILTRNDKLLIGAIILAALASAVPAVLALGAGNGTRAVVTVSGRRVASLPLAQDGSRSIYTAAGVELLQVSQGRVRVTSTDCPRKICKHQGWISRSGQEIVCVPGRMVVRIEGGGEAVVDAVSK